ncbi:MAG: ATP-binding protein [Candidatus Kapabacteria bacterium]|nr:ATP-binding protein [Candidatus Kapabacteria bacterium]
MRFINLPIRIRLAILHTAVAAASICIFSLYTFFSIKKELVANLDVSLNNVCNSINYILEKKQLELELRLIGMQRMEREQSSKFENIHESEEKKFVGPIKTPSLIRAKEEQSVWSAIYDHALSNPRNYIIQIADTNGKIIWRSKTLEPDSLPVIPDDSLLMRSKNLPNNIFNQSYLSGKAGDSLYFVQNRNGQDVRIFAKRTNSAVITVGYTLEYIEKSVNGIIKILLLSFPLILLISVLGGVFLSKFALKPIDEIITTSDGITADKLFHRYTGTGNQDEIGRLKLTLNKMIERLDHSFSKTRNFNSDVSHELKTPLTILQGELELALNNPPKDIDGFQDVIASALEEIQRLSLVVESLLEISRAESGHLKLNIESVNLSSLMEDMAEDAEVLSELKDITVVKNLEQGVICEADKVRLHQAIINIVENAIKYSSNGSYISLGLSQEKGYAVIKISDTGMGIPNEQMPFIFDRFYRVDKARQSNIQGSGLGLAIVKSVITAHNAEIFVESKIDKGTTFLIYLPLKH